MIFLHRIGLLGGYPSTQYLLDVYSGAEAAYSLRVLSSSFASSAVVRVRRSSDNAEADFTATEITDGTLTTWTGANDGFVVTWYDQSGNANDVTQSTASQQPQLVASGSVVANGISFDGSNDGLLTSSSLSNVLTNASLFCVSKNATNSGQKSMFRIRPNGTFGTVDGLIWEQGFTGSTSRYGGNTAIEGANGTIGATTSGQGTQDTNKHLNSFIYGQSQISAFQDGSIDETLSTVRSGSAPIGNVTLQNPIWIGYNFDSNDRAFGGGFDEIIFYPSDQSANRTGIETNINDHYSIY